MSGASLKGEQREAEQGPLTASVERGDGWVVDADKKQEGGWGGECSTSGQGEDGAEGGWGDNWSGEGEYMD